METRGLWWNIHDIPHYKEIFYAIFFVALAFFTFGFFIKIKNWSRGKPKNDFGAYLPRVINMFEKTFFHKGWGKNKFIVAAHILVFYGFFALWIGTDILTVQDRMPVYFFEGMFYKTYSFIMDLFGILLLLGCAMFAYIRYVVKPKRLDNRNNDWIQITFLAVFVIVGFLIEGIRQSATNQIEIYAPIGAGIAYVFNNVSYELKKTIHASLWWFHSAQTFFFVAIIPYTKLSHIFIAPANIFFENSKPKGKLNSPFNLVEIMAMDEPPDDLVEGVSEIEDFSWKDLMDLDACTTCGKCQDICPATATNKPLSPKWLIQDLKSSMYGKEIYDHGYSGERNKTSSNLTEVISKETLWSCTSCSGCVEVCPVGIDQLSKIIDLRRTLISENKAPENLVNTLRNIRTKFNPWGQPVEDREKWAEGLDVPKVEASPEFEYLYWVGCAGAYDSRNQNVARTVAGLLKKADVKFAVLGKQEKCTGDTARRAGDEGLFQELAIENIETFKAVNVKKIITHCPHCFNTFKNEYPEFGLEKVEVFHHSDVLWDLIKEGKLTLNKEVNEQITFHDSCYLGRHNDKYSNPRKILKKIPGLKYKEMENSKETGTCCGGGGAQLWYEAPGEQINVKRLNEVKDAKANTVATGCPFCTIMLETAKTLDKSETPPSVKDISELISESVS